MPRPSPRVTVWIVALVAILARYPGMIWPLRPDEAGFLLVARNWDPQPGSMFGTYWVDRHPLVIAVVKAAAAVGGPDLQRPLADAGHPVEVARWFTLPHVDLEDAGGRPTAPRAWLLAGGDPRTVAALAGELRGVA
jgi:hypothetical protein